MFKIGDYVELSRDRWGIKAGGVVKVIAFWGNGNIGVETEYYSRGHSCSGIGRDGHCWWVIPDDLKISNISLENK